MISKTKVADKTVVFKNIFTQSLDLWFILEMKIAFKESLIQFNDLSQGEMLARGLVQTSSGLAKLHEK